MAGHRARARGRSAPPRSPPATRASPTRSRSGRRRAALGRRRRVVLDDPERVEARRRQLAGAVDGAQRARRPRPASPARAAPRRHLLPSMKLGDEARRVVEHRRDRAARPRRRGRALRSRCARRRGRSPSMLGVLARQPDDDVGAAEAGAEVAVGDPAVERRRLAVGLAQAPRTAARRFLPVGPRSLRNFIGRALTSVPPADLGSRRVHRSGSPHLLSQGPRPEEERSDGEQHRDATRSG